MLKAMHPILPNTGQEKNCQDLHPQWAQLIGKPEQKPATQKRIRKVMQNRQNDRTHYSASDECLDGCRHQVSPEHVSLRNRATVGVDAFDCDHGKKQEKRLIVGEGARKSGILH